VSSALAIGGRLVLIVGPSGAGKDTLIAGAREALKGADGIVFARREITREKRNDEDHDPVDRASFEDREQGGEYALSWRAHGLAYAVRRVLAEPLSEGRTVVVNASRQVIPLALARFGNLHVVHITAPRELLAKRLVNRGRESFEEIQSRLDREAGWGEADGVVLHNDGTIAEGVSRLVAILKTLNGD
jgi:ribose 1,5-bisphosphokinase